MILLLLEAGQVVEYAQLVGVVIQRVLYLQVWELERGEELLLRWSCLQLGLERVGGVARGVQGRREGSGRRRRRLRRVLYDIPLERHLRHLPLVAGCLTHHARLLELLLRRLLSLLMLALEVLSGLLSW